MMDGAEEVAWDSTPWDQSLLLSEVVRYRDRAHYTFGYTFGYLREQAITGVVATGTFTVGKLTAKGGISMIGKIAPRAKAITAIRLHYLKGALANFALMDDGLRPAYEGMMSSMGRLPTSPTIKEIPASLMENRMGNGVFARGTFNFSNVVKAASRSTNIQKLIKTVGREGQFARNCAMWMQLMADSSTANAAKGWVEALERLLKFDGNNFLEDRADDLCELFKIDTPQGREAMRKSLEDYAVRVSTDPNAKLLFKDVEKIQVEGYRYSNFDPRFDENLNPVPGPPKLGVHPDGGWYAGFASIDSSAAAISRNQLPIESVAKFRLEFDWDAVKDNVRIPKGMKGDAEWFEPLCKDYPPNGLGGDAQVLIDGVEVPIKRIWDISGANPIQVYP